jgi:uncharacterized membrane protein YqjE
VTSYSDQSRGFGQLLSELARSSADLIRGEVKLARLELAAIASNAGRGSALVVAGALMLLFGGLSLITGIILLVGDQWLTRDRYWLAALLLTLLAGAASAMMARRALRRLSPSELVPGDTIATLKEDKEWLKQRLTSVAT